MHNRHPYRQLASLCALLILTTVSNVPAKAQESSPPRDETTTGIVTSSTRSTLVIRDDDGQYRLFTYQRGATRPASIPAGSQVRVTWTPSDEPGVRIASNVTVLKAAAAGSTAGTTSGVVPPEVRRLERDIERQARRYQAGVRAGVALDPELVLIGVHAQVGPFFNPDVFLRPNVEFAYGEVTALFGLNLEAIYRLPVSRQGRWSTYVGVGPGFNFIHQNFKTTTSSGNRIDFGDFHYDVGLNLLGGIRYRSGMFMELKTSVYSKPAPTFRLIVGYNF